MASSDGDIKGIDELIAEAHAPLIERHDEIGREIEADEGAIKELEASIAGKNGERKQLLRTLKTGGFELPESEQQPSSSKNKKSKPKYYISDGLLEEVRRGVNEINLDEFTVRHIAAFIEVSEASVSTGLKVMLAEDDIRLLGLRVPYDAGEKKNKATHYARKEGR